MKKTLLSVLLSLFVIGTLAQTAIAAAELPKSSVWFEPSSAAIGEPITLNALVYNSQNVDATVTVSFSSPAGVIGTASTLVAKSTAKTLSVSWKMPETSTVVTGAVVGAADSAKKSVPGLVGTLGTVTVGSTVTPTIAPLQFPGSKQINAWFAPILSKVERFRIEQRDYFTKLKTDTQKKLDIVNKPALDDKNIASKALGNPADYVVLVYATVGAGVFVSQALFYVAGVLMFLLLLRFLVNLVF